MIVLICKLVFTLVMIVYFVRSVREVARHNYRMAILFYVLGWAIALLLHIGGSPQ